MKRLLILIAALAFAPAMLAPFAVGKTAEDQAAAQDPKAEEAAAYKAWYDANAAKDYPKAMELAKAYLEKFPSGNYAKYLKETWLPGLFNQAIKVGNIEEMIRIGKIALALDPDSLDYLLAMINQIRTKEFFATPQNFSHASDYSDFARRAMPLIESGKTPTGTKDFKKEPVLAFLNYDLGLIENSNKNQDKALEYYEKAAALDPSTAAYFRDCGVIHQVKYLPAAKKYQAFSDADRDAAEPKPEVKAALDEVKKEADAVINCWVRYMGLTMEKPSDTRKQVETVLTELYKFRNNGSTEGLQKLIEQNKSSATPVKMPPPAEPAKTSTEQKPAEQNAASAKPVNAKPANKKP